MGAIRLNRRAMEWGFPWTAAIHPMEIDLNGEATALCRACPQCGRCPGLSNRSRREQGAHLREERSAAAAQACDYSARFVLADGWHNAAALLPPAGGSSIRHPSLTILSPVSRSKAAASTRQDSTPLLFNPARPSVGEAEGRVLCSWRLDEIEARFWRAPPGGLRRCLPGRINQNRLVLFETPLAVSVLASRPPTAAGSGGRGNRWDTSECFAPPIRTRGPNLLAEVLFTVYCILRAKPGIPTRRLRQT